MGVTSSLYLHSLEWKTSVRNPTTSFVKLFKAFRLNTACCCFAKRCLSVCLSVSFHSNGRCVKMLQEYSKKLVKPPKVHREMELVEHKVDNSVPCTCERASTSTVISVLLSESLVPGESSWKEQCPVRSPAVDEERMRPGHWLWSVL